MFKLHHKYKNKGVFLFFILFWDIYLVFSFCLSKFLENIRLIKIRNVNLKFE